MVARICRCRAGLRFHRLNSEWLKFLLSQCFLSVEHHLCPVQHRLAFHLLLSLPEIARPLIARESFRHVCGLALLQNLRVGCQIGILFPALRKIRRPAPERERPIGVARSHAGRHW